jgi:hypothetical protein
MTKEQLLDPNGILFPAWNIVMKSEPSDLILTFCLAELGLSMTSNKFRALWEMRADYMYKKRYITLEQRNAVSGINTHGGICYFL